MRPDNTHTATAYLIRNGRVIDPVNGIDARLDVLVSGGKIGAVGASLRAPDAAVIDAEGMIVAPGLIDMHTHLREPGREDKETVASGTRAALRGGYTCVACMPNTDPALDNAAVIGRVREIIDRDAVSGVSVVGAITRGREGKELADLLAMKRAGVVAISDDGSSVEDEELMLAALRAASMAALPVIAHCEDPALAGRGVVNKGFVSTKLGLRGISKASEYTRVGRDIALAAKAKARVHIAHVSCAESVELIRKAKKAGTAVTAETCPHYFTLTEECCVTYDTNTKMNPPLRTAADVQALKEGLRDGAIDAIATDHAPHTDCEKDVEFDLAPFGIIGLETALPLAVMELIDTKVLTWPELITLCAVRPARILGLSGGTLTAGAAADVVVIDPAAAWTYSKEEVCSKSRNSPFIDWKLKGRARHVFVGGKLALKHSAIV